MSIAISPAKAKIRFNVITICCGSSLVAHPTLSSLGVMHCNDRRTCGMLIIHPRLHWYYTLPLLLPTTGSDTTLVHKNIASRKHNICYEAKLLGVCGQPKGKSRRVLCYVGPKQVIKWLKECGRAAVSFNSIRYKKRERLTELRGGSLPVLLLLCLLTVLKQILSSFPHLTDNFFPFLSSLAKITIKEMILKIIPKRIVTFRLCPSTKVRIHRYNCLLFGILFLREISFLSFPF